MKGRTPKNQAADGPLPPADQQRLEAAEGWLHLGDHISAFKELEEITADSRAHPAVLRARYDVYARAEKWESAFQLAEGMSRMDGLSDTPEPFLLRSRAADHIQERGLIAAFDLLNDVAQHFHDSPEFAFQLARYACRLGRIDEARRFLLTALAAADVLGTRDEWKRRARAEPELAALW